MSAERLTNFSTSSSAQASSERLSRPTSAAMSGKQTCSLKTLVSDEVAEDFGKFARLRGYGSASDCLRELVLIAVYGADYVANLHSERIRSLVPNRDAIGTEAQ